MTPMIQRAFSFLLGSRHDTGPAPRSSAMPDSFSWRHGITVHLVSPPRSRRYLLRLLPDGSARLAIPRRGSRAEALRFLERSEAWLLRRHEQWRSQSSLRQPWQAGASFLFRGEKVLLQVTAEASCVTLSFGGQTLSSVAPSEDYRPFVHAHLRRLAEEELPPRTRDLAALHGLRIRRVTVRAQKTRWGSCSAQGTISLNWRLIQAPPFVLDYLIIHELMHLREMNHSARYWKQVGDAFPRYREAEVWLKKTRLEGLI